MAQINNGETGLSARTKMNESIAKTDSITDVGGGVIPSSAQLSKVDSITDVGSGVIISDAERTKLSGIDTGAQVNEELAVFFGTLTSSGTSISLDSRYTSYSGSFTASRTGVGTYRITSSALFSNGTFVSLTPNQECFFSVEVANDSLINIQTFDSSASLADDILTNALLKIENYQL